jgi:ABC-type thiamin/hydroxymethylpyrimidine transport system permease subunit
LSSNRPFHFTTHDLVIIAVLVAISGVFQTGWAILVFQLKLLGPLSTVVTNVGFFVWGYVALYFVPVPGAATLVKGFGSVIEVLTGNPFGPVAIAYGTLEGVAADLAYVVFGRRLSINMMIVGALMSQLFTSPIDITRDAVPLRPEALAAYYAPGIAGTVLTGWLSSILLATLKRVGINPRDRYSSKMLPKSDQEP